jgi:hypothetical protein
METDPSMAVTSSIDRPCCRASSGILVSPDFSLDMADSTACRISDLLMVAIK